MNRKQLNLLKNTLEEAERADTGAGHWLPEQFKKDLRKSINLVNRALRDLPKPIKGTISPPKLGSDEDPYDD